MYDEDYDINNKDDKEYNFKFDDDSIDEFENTDDKEIHDYITYNGTKKDPTVSNTILPFTGLKYILSIFTLLFITAGIYSFIKYNKNKDIN